MKLAVKKKKLIINKYKCDLKNRKMWYITMHANQTVSKILLESESLHHTHKRFII